MRAAASCLTAHGQLSDSRMLDKPSPCTAVARAPTARKQQARGGHPMHAWYLPVKVFALVVVLLMVVAMAYAGTMAVMYWSGIGV